MDGAEPRSCNKISDHAVYLGEAKLKVEGALDKTPKLIPQNAKLSISRTNINHKNTFAFSQYDKAMQLAVDAVDLYKIGFGLLKWSFKVGKFLKNIDISIPKNTLFSGLYVEIKNGLKMAVDDSKINVHNMDDDWVGAGTYNFYNKSIYFTIETRVNGIQLAHGGQVFSNIVDKFDEIYGRKNVEEIQAEWNEDLPDNLNTFNREFNALYKDGKGMELKAAQQAAARKTFTGIMAERHGFQGVEILGTEGKHGQYTQVDLIFNDRK